MNDKVIKQIAKAYRHLPTNGWDSFTAYGVIIRNTEINGMILNDHPKGKAITRSVLAELGYEPLTKRVSININIDEDEE